MRTRTVASLTAFAVLAGCWTLSAVKQSELEQRAVSLSGQVSSVSLALSGAEVEIDKKQEETTLLEKQSDDLQRVLDLRSNLISVSSEAVTALTSADGKVDVSDLRNRLIASQVAYSKSQDTTGAQAAIDAVKQVTAEASSRVGDFDRQAAEAASRSTSSDSGSSSSRGSQRSDRDESSAPRQSDGGGGNSDSGGGGGDYFSEARSILDSFGGGWVRIESFDGNCAGTYTWACSSPGGSIMVSPDFAGRSSWNKRWTMMHEYAHQFQFPIMGAIQGSPTYQSLFGGNGGRPAIEWLANCMASLRGYEVWSCSQAQYDYASAVWAGSAP